MFLRISVFYVLTWFFLILLGGLQQATGLLPPEVGLAQWGPGVAALLMLILFRKDGHRIMFFSKKIPPARYVYAALAPVGAALVIFVLRFLFSMQPSPGDSSFAAVLPLILWMPFGAVGEELGWRGYLHKGLDTRLRGLPSSVLVGLLWMPIHVVFLGRGPLMIFFLALLMISYSIVLYVLLQDTQFNVALASVFHLFINLSNLLFLDVIYEIQFMMLNAMVWAVLAVVVIIMRPELFLATKR